MKLTLERTLGASAAALITSSATLVCCVFPAVMVSLGAGAVLAGLVTAVPQIVWLSEHKGWVFGVAGVMLVLSGLILQRASRLACPTEPVAARACHRLRRLSAILYWSAVGAYTLGGGFVLLAQRLIHAVE
jgi:hypothetical protein